MKKWFLHLCRAKTQVGARLIVILDHVTSFSVAMNRAEIQRVLRRDLLLEVEAEFALLEIVVRPLSGVRTVERLEQVTAVLKGPKLRALFDPGAPAQILRRGCDTEPVALE